MTGMEWNTHSSLFPPNPKLGGTSKRKKKKQKVKTIGGDTGEKKGRGRHNGKSVGP